MRQLRGLREDYARLIAALSYVELVAAVMPWEEPSESAYGTAIGGLTALSMHEDSLIAAVWAQLKLMQLTGFLPSFEFCVSTGVRVQESYGYVVPAMGGYVVEPQARAASDRYLVRAEALVGLARTAELAVPPPRLKFADECLYALLPVWGHITDLPLPATGNYADFVRGQATSA
jgi:recombinational DNA repair protein (RecF pathway)